MSKHRPFCLAGLRYDAITGEPQLYAHDRLASSARPHSSSTDVLPLSNRQRAFRRFVTWALRRLNIPPAIAALENHTAPASTTKRSSGSEQAIRNAGPSAPGFAP
jgi:hypothetical protein